MNELDKRIDLAILLVSRLERLSADSYWAHQASGLRGSLLRALDQIESGQQSTQPAKSILTLEQLDQLINRGFEILENAAREILPPGEIKGSG